MSKLIGNVIQLPYRGLGFIGLKCDPRYTDLFMRTVKFSNYLRIALHSATRCTLEKSCETEYFWHIRNNVGDGTVLAAKVVCLSSNSILLCLIKNHQMTSRRSKPLFIELLKPNSSYWSFQVKTHWTITSISEVHWFFPCFQCKQCPRLSLSLSQNLDRFQFVSELDTWLFFRLTSGLQSIRSSVCASFIRVRTSLLAGLVSCA